MHLKRPPLIRALGLMVLLSLALAQVGQAATADLQLRSGPGPTHLLELYTSEGCSSCPPADRWLSALVDDTRLWNTVVPVAFHVDYWDYIGWKDRFARKTFGQRQQAYRRHGSVRSVYTPGFVVDGQEWRGWFVQPDLKLPAAPDPGVLAVNRSGDRLSVEFVPTSAGRGETPVAHVAVLGFALSTAVKSGENHGRQLNHDFVVIGYEQVPLQSQGGTLRAALILPAVQVSAPRTALAVWISHRDDPRPVQAVGGWM